MGFCERVRLLHPIQGHFNVRLFASGATTGSCETLSFLENIAAGQTFEGQNDEPLSLRRHGASHVRKMMVDILFPDTYGLGKVAGAQIVFGQELGDLFPNRVLVGRDRSSVVQKDETSLCRSSCPSISAST